jgi:2-dehydropantoate 2-reductase
MEEIVLIAQKRHIGIPADIVGLSMAKANNFPYETKTSYQRDSEHKGKHNEGDLFGATILRIGKELGIPTPVTELIYNKILTGASL